MQSPQSAQSRGMADLPVATDLSGEFRKYIGRQVSYATHGIHKYPAKFIPQIPRFCIESCSTEGDLVLDPFMGSGTALLEAYIAGRDSCGIDIHPLAKLIAKVKTTPMEPGHLNAIADGLLEDIKGDSEECTDWIPEIPNREHWFRPRVLNDLARIKRRVWQLKGGDSQDFFKICFSSIIRRVSNSDDDSLIPEVTSFQKKLDQQGKTKYDAIAKFENTVKSKLLDAANLWRLSCEVQKKYRREPKVRMIGRDARDIDLEDASVDLAVTSPPYASAVHYVSVHKLEMFWLEMIDSTADLDSRTVGTARAYVDEYRDWEPETDVRELSEVLDSLMQRDRKSAYIVHKYFCDMGRNLSEVNRVLRRRGRYCMVVGENTFRRVRIPTYRILAGIAKTRGFCLKNIYVYDVINRHLDIPRWNDSRIERDYILVLEKERKSPS